MVALINAKANREADTKVSAMETLVANTGIGTTEHKRAQSKKAGSPKKYADAANKVSLLLR